MKFGRLFCFLGLVLLVLGCKEKEPETYYVSQEMLRYCWFPNGSYWIYEEGDSSGAFDSVYASGASTRIYQDEGDDYLSERYGLTLTIQGKQRRQVTIAWPTAAERQYTLSKTSELFSDSSGQQVDCVFFWNTSGSDTMSSNPLTFVQKRYDSIAINGRFYHDAIEIATSPETAADWTYNVIWAKDVGVIRRSMLNGTQWSLVRYRIGQ